MEINKEIGARLREFADKKYKSMADFARALEIRPQQVYDYFNGKSKPGNKMQSKLRKLGCDIGWLITGKTIDEVQQSYDRDVLKLIEKGLAKEDYEMIDILHGFGIRNRFELEQYLNFEALTKKIIKAAEEAGKHERTKRKEGK